MIFNKVKNILDEYIDIDIGDITLETRLADDLGINSYEFMSIIGAVEEEFDVEVDEKDILKLVTVADLLDYISSFKEENVLV